MSLFSQKGDSSAPHSAAQSRTMALVQALNNTAFSLQKAIRSENDVFRVFREQVSQMGLRGAICLLNTQTSQLTLKSLAFSQGPLGSLLGQAKAYDLSDQPFDLKSIPVFGKVIQTQSPQFVEQAQLEIDNNESDRLRSALYKIIDKQSRTPAIVVPLRLDGTTAGVLCMAGEGLSQHDVPGMEAFGNQLAVALENARLFGAMQHAYGQMKESEAKYRNVVEHSNDGICIVQNQRIQYANEQLCNLLGQDRTSLHNLPFANLVDQNTRHKILEQFENLLDGHRHEQRFEATMQSTGNRSITAEITISATMLDSKQAVLAFIRDVTHAATVEQEIQKVEKLESLGILAGGIAHDFNNILTAILSSIGLAGQLLPKGEDCTDILAQAERAALRARDLTQQLLTFSKGGEPVKRDIDIKGIIGDATRFALRGTNVDSRFAIDNSLWSVTADQGQIGQVMHNLVINASQAMSEGGIVTVSASNVTVGHQQIIPLKEGKYVKVVVADTGSGIPQAYLSRVFDPFFTTKPTGSGLGLATTYSIIKKHDGAVFLDSKLAVGTTVTFYLPAAATQVGAAPSDVSSQIERGTGRILVMDDEAIVRKSAGQLLKFIGYDAELVSSGSEAIDQYKKARAEGRPFSAVIMDLTIPAGLGGKETIKRLKEIDPDVRAVVSSGYSNDPIISSFREHGFKAVLSKPYSIQELSSLLRKVLD